MQTNLPISHVEICVHSEKDISRDSEDFDRILRDTTTADTPEHLQNKMEKVSDNFDDVQIEYSEGGFDTPPVGGYDKFMLNIVEDKCHCHAHVGPGRIREVLNFQRKSLSSVGKIVLDNMNIFINIDDEDSNLSLPVETEDNSDVDVTSVTYTFNDSGDQLTVAKTETETRIHAQTSESDVSTDELEETVESKLSEVERHIEEVLK